MAICIYNNCNSVQKPFSSISFFALPKDHRRKLWIENSGNEVLATISESAKRVVCQKHFHPSSLRIQFHRTILSRDAVPVRWDADKCTNSVEDTCGEPIEVIECDDNIDKRQSHDIKIIQIVDECDEDGDGDGDARQDVTDWQNNYENNSVEEAEGIELVEIENDEHLPTLDKCTVDTNSDQCQQIDDEAINQQDSTSQSPNQFPSYFHEIEIETADNPGKRKMSDIGGSGTSVKSAKQSSIKAADRDRESENVQCNAVVASDVSVSSSTSKSQENASESAHVTNEEDKYFSMAVVGILQRISPQQKAFAKVNILRYLTELEYGLEATIK